MYLIISNEQTNKYLSSALSKSNINTVAAMCNLLIPDTVAIRSLSEEINNFDIIIITSPSAIEYTSQALANADKHTIFIVPGFSSYTKLRRYTDNKIYAPENSAGATAMISQVLDCMDLSQKKIAILQGETNNQQLQEYFTLKLGMDSYTSIILYQQKWLDLDTQFLKKLFISNCLQGIILTSSSHAKYVFSQASRFGYYDTLLKTNFITLHTKIKQVLQAFGVKQPVVVSDIASNQSLVDTIRKLHDRDGK